MQLFSVYFSPAELRKLATIDKRVLTMNPLRARLYATYREEGIAYCQDEDILEFVSCLWLGIPENIRQEFKEEFGEEYFMWLFLSNNNIEVAKLMAAKANKRPVQLLQYKEEARKIFRKKLQNLHPLQQLFLLS